MLRMTQWALLTGWNVISDANKGDAFGLAVGVAGAADVLSVELYPAARVVLRQPDDERAVTAQRQLVWNVAQCNLLVVVVFVDAVPLDRDRRAVVGLGRARELDPSVLVLVDVHRHRRRIVDDCLNCRRHSKQQQLTS